MGQTGSSTWAAEGGAGGRSVVCVGTPEELAANPASHTGQYLAPYLVGTRV